MIRGRLKEEIALVVGSRDLLRQLVVRHLLCGNRPAEGEQTGLMQVRPYIIAQRFQGLPHSLYVIRGGHLHSSSVLIPANKDSAVCA